MNIEDLPKILRKLQHNETIVERLLANPEPRGSPSSVPFATVCKEKIQALEDAVFDLPDDGNFADIVREWREVTIVRLWKKYFAVAGSLNDEAELNDHGRWKIIGESSSEDDGVDDSRPAVFLSLSSDNSFSGSLKISSDRTTPVKSKLSSMREPRQQLKNVPHQSGSLRRNLSLSSSTKEPVDVELKKDHLRAQLKKSFASTVPIDNAADIDSMKELVVVVAKAASILGSAKWVDRNFQEEMLELVLPLVPEDKMEIFVADCQVGKRLKRLCDLKVFISELIGTHYSSLNRSIIEQKMRSTWQAATGELFCKYCRTLGHEIEDCSEVLEQECFKVRNVLICLVIFFIFEFIFSAFNMATKPRTAMLASAFDVVLAGTSLAIVSPKVLIEVFLVILRQSSSTVVRRNNN